MLVVEPDLPNIEILFSRFCTLGVLYTHFLCLGVQGRSPREFVLGCVLANSFADPCYWVTHSIFSWYFPYKRKHCKVIVYCIVAL